MNTAGAITLSPSTMSTTMPTGAATSTKSKTKHGYDKSRPELGAPGGRGNRSRNEHQRRRIKRNKETVNGQQTAAIREMWNARLENE